MPFANFESFSSYFVFLLQYFFFFNSIFMQELCVCVVCVVCVCVLCVCVCVCCVCVCVVCVCMCVCVVCVCVCVCVCARWNLNSGCLEEQQLLLSPGPSLQPGLSFPLESHACSLSLV
jgi:hypothetical protein